MILIRKFAAAAVAAVSLAGAANAQQADVLPNPRGVVQSVAFEDIRPVLVELGAQVSIQKQGDQDVMVVRIANRTLLFRQNACRAFGDCAGLVMEAVINTQRPDLETVNRFQQLSYVSTAVVYNNAFVLERYLIADYGITRGSFAINVAAFSNAINEWFRYEQSGSAPTATIAEQLNTRGLVGDGGDDIEGRAREHNRRATRSVTVVDASLEDDAMRFANTDAAATKLRNNR